MPVTCLFSCLGFLGLLCLVPAVPISVALLAGKRKRAALFVLCVPAGLIVLSVALTLTLFAVAKLYSLSMSARPEHLFRVTFGFEPSRDTTVLDAHHETIMDCGTTVMRFRTTPDVIARITSARFVACDQETFTREYRGNGHNLPEPVQSWFLPAAQDADRFYIAGTFDKSFAHSAAILCYDEETQVACFHWVGID